MIIRKAYLTLMRLKWILRKIKYYIHRIWIILTMKPSFMRTLRLCSIIPTPNSVKLNWMKVYGYDISNIDPYDQKAVDQLIEQYMKDKGIITDAGGGNIDISAGKDIRLSW